jgi:hypothetical protein
MPRLVRFSDLSSSRRALVRLCQALNYGEIQDMRVQDGDPIFDPAPVLLVELKLDADETKRQEVELADFELRDEVCRLMARLDELENGTIGCIEVRAGIPRRVIFKSSSAAILR